MQTHEANQSLKTTFWLQSVMMFQQSFVVPAWKFTVI